MAKLLKWNFENKTKQNKQKQKQQINTMASN